MFCTCMIQSSRCSNGPGSWPRRTRHTWHTHGFTSLNSLMERNPLKKLLISALANVQQISMRFFITPFWSWKKSPLLLHVHLRQGHDDLLIHQLLKRFCNGQPQHLVHLNVLALSRKYSLERIMNFYSLLWKWKLPGIYCDISADWLALVDDVLLVWFYMKETRDSGDDHYYHYVIKII